MRARSASLGGALTRSWRSGTRRSQSLVLGLLLLGVLGCFCISLPFYSVLPVSTYFLWLLVGMLLLRYRELMVLTVVTTVGALGVALWDGLSNDTFGSARASGMIALVVGGGLALWHARGQRTGLPTPLGEAMLADLRERLQEQGRVPDLPAPWGSQTAMIAAHDVGYAGDFMMAALDEDAARLEVILVDVVGKGVAAGVDALQFAGALGGLIGALEPASLMEAANDFLLRLPGVETFATAAYARIDLDTGDYCVLSAGHPPALRYDGVGVWEVDNARGLALGILRHPDLESSTGRLEPGQALMFYTDGVVESRGGDIEDGIDWLRRVAARAVAGGFDGAARRIVRQVSRGDDDRAVFVVNRGA